jgi:hypothetical protein
MISQIEKERQAILQQLNNQGRRLERISPALASELNVKLSKLVEWLAASLAKNPRGPKGK